MKSKFDTPKLENEVVEILKKAEIPVSIDYVSHHTHVGWDTARAVLLSLALQGRIKSQKTTKSYVFSSLDDGENTEAST